MNSRLTLIAILAMGMLMGGTTAALAADSAGSAQYAPEEEERHFCEESGGVEGANGCEHPCEESSSGSAGSTGSAGENCEHQETEPQEAEGTTSEGKLPFTGFPVAPALIVGIGLLGAGVAMRLRLRSGGGLA